MSRNDMYILNQLYEFIIIMTIIYLIDALI